MSPPAARASGSPAHGFTAIADAKTYGSTSILLVPGKVSNTETENFDQVWSRSQEEIKKVLPQIEQSGARLAIEVVWNDFLTPLNASERKQLHELLLRVATEHLPNCQLAKFASGDS